jgi:hypothetical protein
MAKKKPNIPAAPATPNLFAKATEQKPKSASKNKGTIFALPNNAGPDGRLSPEIQLLHDSLKRINEAHREEEAAKNKSQMAKGILGKWVLDTYCNRYVQLGADPETPISIVNNQNDDVTYIMQDKAEQNALDEERIELLQGFLGCERASNLIVENTTYSFNAKTMLEPSFDEEKTVQDVVFEIVSKALMNDQRLSSEQKENLISRTTKTCLKKGCLPRLISICGDDPLRIKQFFEIVGSCIVRYLKAS